MTDTYNTVSAPSEGIFKDKGSRFLAFLYPVKNEEEIRELLQKIKKEHYNARHHCYAWRLGKEEIRFRANDDGEPSSTAGKPILGQLVSKELTQVLLVVVRYFGGILLGTGGLIHAYREAAADAIRNASIETRLIEEEFQLNFNYSELNTVMQIIKNENLTQTSVNLTEKCKITFSVRKSDIERILSLFRNIYGVEISGSTSVNN
ncbi:MAG TPA: YigZ family protein [Prolixibacteraceae bacterium]|nr:YigZ family protein [Prolixibacteraceae bacterium]HOS00911.1 YigZ family protein [Prolixibacteraceae bacterium]HPL45987.1 YigZ family protein [Prolixibacteraceae bacterium]HQH75440.1 YigZ family protein [Prolixibacteraceae bacterium]